MTHPGTVGGMVEPKVKDVSGALKRGVGGVGGVAGETLKRAGSAVRDATGAVSDATGVAPVQGVGKEVQEAARRAGAAVERAGERLEAGRGGRPRRVGEELREIMRDAALEILVPATRRATREAARYAIARAPALAPKLAARLGPAVEEAGGPTAFAKQALASIADVRAELLEKVGIGAEPEYRPWRERRLPVEASIDIAVPIATAYERFTDFDEYAKFMSSGDVVDERPNERISWERTDRVEANAVITFHRLSDRLTRVMLTYEHEPESMLEKTTSLFSSSRRALGADLARFKAYVELSEQVEAAEAEPGEPEYAREPEGEPEEGPRGEGAQRAPRPHKRVRRRPAPRPPQPRRR